MQTDKCFHLVYFIERDSLLSWFGPIKEMCFFIFTNDQLETSSHQAIIHM